MVAIKRMGACLALAAGVLAGVPAAAQDARVLPDGVARMRAADALPMLTQRVAAAACALESGVGVVHAGARLADAVDGMEDTLAALRDGAPAWGINGPEAGPKMKRRLGHMAEAWVPTRDAAAALAVDKGDAKAAALIAAESGALREKGGVLSAAFVGDYSDPFAVTQADALLFRIASRQKMLTQDIALRACRIWQTAEGSADRAARIEALTEVMEHYGASLRALRHGDPEVGLAPAPTLRIDAQLNTMLSRWAGVRLTLDALRTGQPVGSARRESVFAVLDGELREYDKLVEEYHDHATRAY